VTRGWGDDSAGRVLPGWFFFFTDTPTKILYNTPKQPPHAGHWQKKIANTTRGGSVVKKQKTHEKAHPMARTSPGKNHLMILDHAF
jgi:hypothetical protein